GSAAINCRVLDTRSVTVNTGSGGSIVNVLATAAFTFGAGTTISQRRNGDVVNVGSGGSLAGISGPLTVQNGSAFTGLSINDQSDAFSRTATISASGITGLSAGPINATSFSIRNLAVNGGTGNNTYTIAGTPAAV